MKKFMEWKKIVFTLIFITFIAGPFFQKEAAAASFDDVHNDFWAKDEITYLSDLEVINGYSNGNFGVNDSVTRAQAAVMLVRVLELSTENRPNPEFSDVSTDHSSYEEIATVVDEGLFSKADAFNPGATLTRAQMAKILTNAFDLRGGYPVEFRDVQESFWAYDEVDALITNQITTGYPDFTFRPNEETSRTQFSVFLARILDDSFIDVGSFEPNEFFTYTHRIDMDGEIYEYTKQFDYETYEYYDGYYPNVWESTDWDEFGLKYYKMKDKGFEIGIPSSDGVGWAFKYPLEEGTTWNNYQLGEDDPIGSYEITGTDQTVQTEAGTFHDVVEVEYESNDASVQVVNYYAPGFGPIKTVGNYDKDRYGISTWNEELIRITPDERTYDLGGENILTTGDLEDYLETLTIDSTIGSVALEGWDIEEDNDLLDVYLTAIPTSTLEKLDNIHAAGDDRAVRDWGKDVVEAAEELADAKGLSLNVYVAASCQSYAPESFPTQDVRGYTGTCGHTFPIFSYWGDSGTIEIFYE